MLCSQWSPAWVLARDLGLAGYSISPSLRRSQEPGARETSGQVRAKWVATTIPLSVRHGRSFDRADYQDGKADSPAEQAEGVQRANVPAAQFPDVDASKTTPEDVNGGDSANREATRTPSSSGTGGGMSVFSLR